MNTVNPVPTSVASDNLTNRQKINGWKKVCFGVFGVVAAIGILAYALNLGGIRSSAPDRVTKLEVKAMPVKVSKLELVNSFDEQRTFTGLVKSARASDLSFERTGRLESIEVDESDIVVKGQPLASIDSRNLNAKLLEAKARERQANALLSELRAGPRDETKRAAKAQVELLQAELKQAKDELARRDGLRASGSTSREEYERAATSVQTTQARLDMASRNLEELETGTRQERLTSQEAVVEEMEATVQDLTVAIEKSILKAPYAGQISRRYLDEGAMIAPGSNVLRIEEHHEMEARIGLPPGVIPQLEIGQEHQLKIAGLIVPARLTRVIPEVDGLTRTQQAVFKIDKSTAGNSPAIAPGTIAKIDVISKKQTNGFWVPMEALTPSMRGLWAVMVVEQKDGVSIAVRREVEVIHTQTNRVIIRGTIKADDQVVLTGVHRIVPGARVEPILATATSNVVAND